MQRQSQVESKTVSVAKRGRVSAEAVCVRRSSLLEQFGASIPQLQSASLLPQSLALCSAALQLSGISAVEARPAQGVIDEDVQLVAVRPFTNDGVSASVRAGKETGAGTHATTTDRVSGAEPNHLDRGTRKVGISPVEFPLNKDEWRTSNTWILRRKK